MFRDKWRLTSLADHRRYANVSIESAKGRSKNTGARAKYAETEPDVCHKAGEIE